MRERKQCVDQYSTFQKQQTVEIQKYTYLFIHFIKNNKCLQSGNTRGKKMLAQLSRIKLHFQSSCYSSYIRFIFMAFAMIFFSSNFKSMSTLQCFFLFAYTTETTVLLLKPRTCLAAEQHCSLLNAICTHCSSSVSASSWNY